MDGGDENSREQNVSKRRLKPSDSMEDEEAPKTKRQRVSRACDQCRLSRDKCDGKSSCQTCVANGRDCTYTTSPKKRGIQPGYIRTLELSLALLIGRDFEAQKHLLTQLSSSRSSLRQSIALKDISQSNDLFLSWSNSSICKQIDILLSGSLEGDLPIPELLPQSGQIRPLDLPSEITTQLTLQLPTEFWSLLDHYYTYTHNWLPVSEKNEMLKVAYAYPINEAEVQSTGHLGKHAELWAIIALTYQQKLGYTAASQRAIATAHRLIPQKAAALDTGHVRSLLLLALSSHATGDSLGSWVEIGMAVRILSYQAKLATDDPRLRHLSLACHLIERIISAQLNIAPHLTNQMSRNVTYVEEDGLEEWSPWQPLAGDEGGDFQYGSQSRQPGRCLSIFNALFKACDSLTIVSGGGAWDNGNTHTTSSDWQRKSLSSSVSIPQQLHLETITAWSRFTKRSISTAEFQQTLSRNLSQFKNCGGLGAIPPTLIPIVDDIISSGNSILTEKCRSTMIELLHLWRSSSPGQRPTGHSSGTSDVSYNRGQQLPGAITVPHDASHSNLTPFTIVRTDSGSHPIERWASSIPEFSTQNMPHDNSGIITASMDQGTPSGISDGALNSDFEAIFEEMAQLEGTRQANDGSQFMQNLGLGPESDLRAFFGADYQESDPLLAYLQFDRPPQPGASISSNFPT